LTTEQRQQYRAIGSRLAVYLRERGHELPSRQILQALASDLAAEHNELALPLTDLLLRPAFRQLVAKAGSGRGSLESQALLQSMQNTFAPVIIDALREILFGFIDLPTNPTPHVTETTVNRAAINPKYSEPYVNRGFAKNALGDKQGAISDYNQAIAINPRNSAAYYNRGIIKSALGDK
jgi:tetratricopeptide (TPR) repeat protein